MPNASALKSVANYVDRKKIRPVVKTVYQPVDIVSAYDEAVHGGARGKIVIDFQ